MQKIDLNSGFFGIGIYQPKFDENIGTLWRHAYLYNASFIFKIGNSDKRFTLCTDTTKSYRHVPHYFYKSFNDFKESLPYKAKVIGVEMTESAVYLNKYSHPKQAIYLLGPEDYGLPQDILNQCDDVIKLYSPKPHSMNVAVTGSIVMYDRTIKLGNL